jgi:uncharacterized protein
MFPLGTTLLPGAGIPLQVFEPRYRQMVVDILADDGPPEFGQALITHGAEAGGGDERAAVGTIARMVEIQAIADGRYAFIAVGIERIRIVEWLSDDPYPRAVVERWPDSPTDAVIGHDDLVAATERVGEVLALAARLSGGDLPEVTVDEDADPVLATYRLAAMAPLGAADRYRLLIAPGPVERLRALYAALEDVEAMMKFRLS